MDIRDMRAALKMSVLFFLLSLHIFAQNPSKWGLNADVKGKQLKSGDLFKTNLKAEIEIPWHLYALEQPAGGPIATTIKVTEGKPFEIADKIESPKPTVKFDQNFQIETKFFVNSVKFTVPMKAISDSSADDLALDVRFQLCNDTLCLPPRTVRVTFGGFEDAKKPSVSEETPSNTTSANTFTQA